MATRKKKTVNALNDDWPKINQGTHLTVKTFEDGRTELEWDDDALLAEVRAAFLKAESVLPVATEEKPKRTRKKKDLAK